MRAIVETVPSSKVTFAGIVKQFPGHSGEEPVYAVNKVSLDIEPGQLVTLLGPSGCGKTTTLRMLAGFETLQRERFRSMGRPLPICRRISAMWAWSSRATRCFPT